jgi:iron-sulfur cluster repair protein YtfE (RIC family)
MQIPALMRPHAAGRQESLNLEVIMEASSNHLQPAPGTGIAMTSDDPVAKRRAGHIDLTIMFAMHDAFRRDLSHLARAAGRHHADLEDPARRTAVLAGWELFKAQLHHHHAAEDDGLWPRMRAHLADRPDDLDLLQAMEDEHSRIDPLLAAIDDAFADHDHGHQWLGHAVDALAVELPGHLAHEERDALPLMDKVLTAAEWQGFIADQRRKNGIRGAAQLFPWLLDSAPAERIQLVLKGLPPPLRVVCRRIWQPRYARHDYWEPSVRSRRS